MITIISIFIFHWISDFIFQSHDMSLKKSKRILWLSYHVAVYSALTTLYWSLFFRRTIDTPITTIPLIFVITFVTHWVTDYFTSRWTSRLWAEERVHDFFVAIGFDQLIHATTLLITFNYLIEKI